MRVAFEENQRRVPMVKTLVLLGVPVDPTDFPSASERGSSLLAPFDELLDWGEGELEVHSAFMHVILGEGVHGRGAPDILE